MKLQPANIKSAHAELKPDARDRVFVGAYPERAPEDPCIPNGVYVDYIQRDLPVVVSLDYGTMMKELKDESALIMTDEVLAKLRELFTGDRRYLGYHLGVSDHSGYACVTLERDAEKANA